MAVSFDPDESANSPDRVLEDLEAIVHYNRVVTTILPGAISARNTDVVRTPHKTCWFEASEGGMSSYGPVP